MYTIDAIFLFVFIFALLNVSRLVFRFIIALTKNPPEQFTLNGRELMFFGLSLSYILTYLIKI